MIEDADYDRAVKDIAEGAHERHLKGRALRRYVAEEARAFCEGEPVCSRTMEEQILEDHKRRVTRGPNDGTNAHVGLFVALALATSGTLAVAALRAPTRGGV